MSILTKKLSYLIAILALNPPAFAEIYNCDGKWTNIKCDSTPKKTIKETKGEKISANQSEKSSLLHELRMQSIRAKRDYGVISNISFVEKHCMKNDTSIESCNEKIDSKSQNISELQSKAALALTTKEKNRLKEIELGKNKIENNNVVIINRPRRRIRQRPPIRPIQGSTQSFQTGVSLQLGGSTKAGNLKGNLSAGGSIVSGEKIYIRNPR